MINQEALVALRLRTCAVGSFDVPIEEHKTDPLKPTFHIEGTGFLIAPNVVLTNRHVIAKLNQHIEKHNFPRDRRQVSFFHPEGAGFRNIMRPFAKAVIVTAPHLLDYGLIEVASPPGETIHGLGGVRITDPWIHNTGDAVGVLGYLGGTAFQRSPERDALYRLGPLLQQGHISAIAPWENAPIVDRLLLDLRSGDGLSGAPVFLPATGEVIGIHNTTHGSAVAYALPLDRTVAASLVAALAAAAADGDTPARILNVRRPT